MSGCMRKGSSSFNPEWLWLKCSLKPGNTSKATKSKQSVWKLKRNRKMHQVTSNCHLYLRSNQEVSISNLKQNENNLMRIKVHVVEDYEMTEPITILSSVKWSWLLWNAFHQWGICIIFCLLVSENEALSDWVRILRILNQFHFQPWLQKGNFCRALLKDLFWYQARILSGDSEKLILAFNHFGAAAFAKDHSCLFTSTSSLFL